MPRLVGMSTYRACSFSDRVVLIHDMDEQTVISELDLEQADLLLEQLQAAVGTQLAALRQRGAIPIMA